MLHPLIGLAMRGVIWYQGEDNYNRASTYADMFSALIRGWREEWQQGEFPFYYCQIAPYDYGIITEPGKNVINSAYLREQQAMVEHRVGNSGMAVLLDAGMKTGIHPGKKKVAGERLARLALVKTYGMKGVTAESPYYTGMEVKNDTVIVSFDRAPMWINCKDRFESYNFQVAGKDRVFYPAKAWIQRSKMLVKSERVPHPVAVRYGFENYVEGDLFGEDLPVSSFRSDELVKTEKNEEYLYVFIISVLLAGSFCGDSCNLVWNTQSRNASESMPCGGGDIGMNVWVENDDVLFYLSRSGSFDENNCLLKQGRFRVRLTPNPFAGTASFRQTLHLNDGYVSVSSDNATLIIWVDVFHPVVHVEVKTKELTSMRVNFESWRYEDRPVRKGEGQQCSYKWAIPDGLMTRRDSVCVEEDNFTFFHRNPERTIFDVVVDQQGMNEVKEQLYNPLKNLIFGGAFIR